MHFSVSAGPCTARARGTP
uniref:Uncharacterized protein n=1 Tax=Arundo donax TaxID=35708 RepID=A0A0A8YR81_ARUDO